ncbi:regulatory protein, luxR family [Sphingomonas laterariae]|uniref:Regulatory protein, luxR family n=1 Tax=Edaphosphingomonas laterariae TaxID=861865 RepID=A0A239CXE4_9SPHN|nr:LuxR C-terminal-related transcriptional regulator [Sphingomonas laterariae]SNS24926.1 regulatory protein, luxR family [Sphingomonas laterariae]
MDEICADVIRHFDAAALDSAHWLPALQALSDATRSTHGQLIGIGGPAAIPFNWVTGFAEKALQEFASIDGGSAAVNPRVAAAAAFGDEPVIFEQHYDAVRGGLSSDVYADFSATHDIPYGCQTTLVADEIGFVGLAVLRGEKAGVTSEEDRAIFARITPHVRSAVRLQVALERQGAKLVAGAFEAMTVAAFLCDAGGRVIAFTPEAEKLLQRGRFHLRGGGLACPTAADTSLVRREVRRHALIGPGVIAPPMASLFLPGGPDDEPLVAEIASLPVDRWTFGAGARAVIVIRRRRRRIAGAAEALVAAYGLSPAEADVALRLIDAESREAIAAARDVSVGTVRAQIKAIFGKLGVNREIELVSRLAPLIHGGG